MFQIKFMEKIKAHTLPSVNFFLRKSSRLWDSFEKTWYSRTGHNSNITRRMRFARWITKTTNTHTDTEYVILIAFPRQQWLHERTSMLRLTYIACFVSIYLTFVFLMICTVSTDYFPVHHSPINFYRWRKLCFLWGTMWIYIYVWIYEYIHIYRLYIMRTNFIIQSGKSITSSKIFHIAAKVVILSPEQCVLKCRKWYWLHLDRF
jgi:hypothetical protein